MLSRLRISPKSAVAGACLILAACAATARAQVQTARVSTKDSVRITVVSTRKVDTLIRTVTKCYNAAMALIPCPTTPPPVVTPPIDTTPAPIPPTPGDSSSHEPSGMTLRLERAYNAINENGWTDEGGKWSSLHECGNWMSGCTSYPDLKELMTIQQDATAPHSPAGVGQQWFPKGYQAGGAPAISRHGFSGARSVYVVYWFKYSANWYGESDSEVGKQIYVSGPRSGDGQLCTYTTAQGRGTGNLQLEVHLQCEPTVNRTPNVSPCIVSRGVWHRVELIMTGNSAGASDGAIDWFMDQSQCGHYTGQKWQSAATTFSSVEYTPVYGGTQTKVPADQFIWFDHIRVSGK